MSLSIIKMPISIRTLAVAGALAPAVLAMAPLCEYPSILELMLLRLEIKLTNCSAEQVHTETAAPQEIGSMTADGMLVYSLNHCTIIQTTSCAVSLSTGAPVPSSASDYPVPGGEPSVSSEHWTAPGSGASTEASPSTGASVSTDHAGHSSDAGHSTGEMTTMTTTGPNGQPTVVTSKAAGHSTARSSSETATGSQTATGTATRTKSNEATGTATETSAPTAGAGKVDSIMGLAGAFVAMLLI